ncbi:acetyl-CoA synthetase-like protein, partial [Conidiobolus coronatus NRRL 28638]
MTQYSSTGRFVDLVKDNALSGHNVKYPAVSINEYGKYMDISYENYYNITCHSASYFYEKLKYLSFMDNRNVGLLSYSDSHYLWNMIGLMSTNVAPVLLSPRNSIEATIHLLKESGSRALIYQDYFKDLVKDIQKEIPHMVLIPKWTASFPECLSPAYYKLLVPLESKEVELGKVSFTLHSSGSTSFPKLVSKLNLTLHNSGYRASLSNIPLDRKELSFYPFFHAAGILTMVINSLYLKKTFILSPDMGPGSHFSSKMILELIQGLSPKVLQLLPLMVKELIEYCDHVNSSKGWGILKKIEVVRYGGAQLPKSMIQSLIYNGISPFSSYASTECGVLMRSIPIKSGEYLNPLAIVEDVRYTLKDCGDSVVELIILKDDPCLSCVQDRDEDGNYPTKDLFKIISCKPLLFDYLSRADDTIIHINGEKTNPIPMEDIINRCPYVDVCAVLGAGQQMNTLLVQLEVNEVMSSSLPSVISTIKSFVKSANESAPSHSRIYEEMIIYLPMNYKKKLPVTIKGNLQRAKCAKVFEEEIKESVEKMESGYVSDEAHGLHSSPFVGG